MRVSSWLYLLEQTACGVCLLCAVGLSAGLRKRCLWRILLTALMLSLMSMAGQSSPLLRFCLLPPSALAPLLAWPDAPARFRLRMVAAGAMLALWLTGLLRFMSPLALPGAILLLLGCALLSAAPRFLSHTTAAPPTASVEVRVGPRQLTLTALIDSGNLLRDTITGLPVIIISRRAAGRLIPLLPDAPSPEALVLRAPTLSGMRLLPVRTLSGTAMMAILRPDSVRVLTGAQWQEVSALIGLSPDGYEGFQALLPACLVQPAASQHPRKAILQGG